jgi:uncharacterized LabA/DUF88 family protein
MFKKHASQRLAVLCDADNLEIPREGGQRRRIDWARLLEQMNGRELVRAIYYRPETNFPEEVQHAVEEAGFEVCRTVKNSDAWIAMDAYALAHKADVIAFVGGDGDLQPVATVLKAMGVRVEVWSWADKTSPRLRQEANVFVPLGRDLLK